MDYKRLATRLIEEAAQDHLEAAQLAVELQQVSCAFSQGEIAGRVLYDMGENCPTRLRTGRVDEMAHAAGMRAGWIAQEAVARG